jgi:hypothetical protein
MGLLLTGITYEEARRKWLARAGTGEDRYHVGRYETEEEAAAALRAEQERRQRAELEDPIDHMCKLATSPGASYSSATGVYFDVRSNGPAVTLTALSGGGNYCDAAVVIYACEGSGVGRETERGAWRVVGAGTLKDVVELHWTVQGSEKHATGASTRLALSPPLVVAAGATVGLFVHSAKRDSIGVQLSKRGKLGGRPGEEVDASDSAVSVLKGICLNSKTPFAKQVRCGGFRDVRTDGDGGCYALAGSVEYEMGGCEPSDSTTVCAEADANATASKTSTVNGALATLPLLRGCARRVDGPAADRHHVRESPGEVAGAGRYR